MILTNPKTNEEIESTLTDREACFAINGKAKTPKQKEFALSLTTALCSKRGLSDGQRFWLHKIAIEEPKPAPTPTSNFDNIRSLFANVEGAAKVTFKTEHGTIVLRHAGPTSSRPGVVRVTDAGPFECRKFFGTIDTHGAFTPARNLPEEVGAFLRALDAHPSGVASEIGITTGSCCFCAKKLTHKDSTTVGYGPHCAKKYGLDHGGSGYA
jgi:hypothetical protein